MADDTGSIFDDAESKWIPAFAGMTEQGLGAFAPGLSPLRR
jgi:hypothetical protein